MYTRLSRQSESIRQRLNMNFYGEQTSPTLTSYNTPERAGHSAYSPYPSPLYSPNPTSESADEAILYQINQQIKTTLTDLLNCDSVKHDKALRAWVQDRLMDAEHELKKQRRRRSSASVVANETMRAFEIANHWAPPAPAALSTWRSN
jgi:hypothetical protein